ncbi:MAG: hypothetical protein L6M37_02220 [Candidatus Methylarchaceae archaeon HK02M1]|nr:hypothetical protein [Candidatus Methylarchaceae archaeon HK01M]MCP8311753.1 hypothetical protein [Candidatus Methylarchaceae archaeon HK02M1]
MSKTYSMIVNLNQWFTYGREWLLLPFTILSSLGSIGIIIIYFNIEQSPELLIVLATLFIITNVGVGAFLFKKKGQQVDVIMKGWRSTLPQLHSVSNSILQTYIAEKLEIPVPKQLESWGIKDWDDLRKIDYYVLQKGEQAYAKPIAQKFFGVEEITKKVEA